jgi:hypothetical protein
MASTQIPGYHPIALPDWKVRLSNLTAYVSKLEAAAPQVENLGLDAKTRIDLIAFYISDLEYTLEKANNAIAYYAALTQNYDRLVNVMEESRNQAYDIIGKLKTKIDAAKEYRPHIDGIELYEEKGDAKYEK